MNFHKLALITTLIAFMAIMLGAYTRLSNAGLGCPDWPGCYGQLSVPEAHDELILASKLFPDQVVEVSKAWKEMLHRYVAGTLGLFIIGMCLLAWKNRKDTKQAIILPTLLVGIVIFQALLGMWTVTLLLKPLVVVIHLLFGFTTLAILFWLTISSNDSVNQSMTTMTQSISKKFRILAGTGMLILIMQIALGGWTSSNYAALVCPDLPTCQASWWPEMNFKDAFVLWHGVGANIDFKSAYNSGLGSDFNKAINYDGGVLDLQSRTAIHWVHRMGAMITFFYWLILGLFIYKKSLCPSLSRAGLFVSGLVIIQFCLGLSNVFFHLPLAVAVAHNAMAALLLLSVLFINYHFYHAMNQTK